MIESRVGRMKALCIGRSDYNFNAQVDSLTDVENQTLKEVSECAGGNGVVAASTIGKLGIETYLGSVVGDDTFGNIIKKELEKNSVHTEYMETAYDKRTSISLLLTKKDTKEKRIYNIVKDKLVLKKNEFQMSPDLVYSDGYDYGASLAAYNKYNEKITIINAKICSKEMVELCKYCKYIIAPKEFAEWVSGSKIDFDNSGSLVTVFSALLNRFVQKEIIVTLGNKGALYILDGQIKVMPGLTVEPVDTTGAGDVFGGAFAYALLQGYDLEKAITFANIAGGLSVTKVGTKESIPDLNEIMSYFNQKYGVTQPVAETGPETL
ncbi:MAG: carbohydrate kinase family protein [Firmicutes bacterium]|nr:carbohydrate kinase family protein [Bacillota bacterium]